MRTSNRAINAVRLFKRYEINVIKNMLETVPDGATHVTDDMRMFINEHFDHLDTIKNQVPVLAKISDIRMFVKSHDVVSSFGGYEDAKAVVKMGKHYKYLARHIENWETIYV